MQMRVNPTPTQPAKKRVLIVEDNPDLLDIFRLAFNAGAFDVYLAKDGEAAIEQMQALQPDVLVLDINLPKLTGLDVLDYIKKQQANVNIKVIVATGNTVAIQDERARGADLLLMKPVNIRDLLTFTRRLTT